MTDFTMFDFKVTDGVAVATFNRPDKMNTFTPVVMREMIQLFDLTDKDDAIRAVVITGSGRAFCAGLSWASRAGTRSTMPSGLRATRSSITAFAAMAAGAWCCASSRA